ncbi:MAG: hypothetical protein SynsKO_02570 [Synoicihabitans sp.]
MKPELTPDELLLYWSNELPADERADVEARLTEDADARAYLEELTELGDGVAELPQATTERDWNSIVAEEADVVEIPSRRPAKVIPFWQHRVPQLIAASVLALLSLLWLTRYATTVVDPEQTAPPHEIAVAERPPEESVIAAESLVDDMVVAEAPSTVPRKLSTRLFQSTSRLSARDRLQSLRERRAGLLDRSSFIRESSS